MDVKNDASLSKSVSGSSREGTYISHFLPIELANALSQVGILMDPFMRVLVFSAIVVTCTKSFWY